MKAIYPLFFLIILFLSSCFVHKQAPTAVTSIAKVNKVATHISTDKSYGYTEKNPICVGNKNEMGGPADERSFLNSLSGPNGETIRYNRTGSCCPFKTKNGLVGGSGMLDIYEVSYAGLKQPVLLYINMYDAGPIAAPVGFTVQQ